jgi:hypothetical protein|tara:strand:- start:282 stop:476 length:195 start_codon:yes stop_codon:yes gene_type:complete
MQEILTGKIEKKYNIIICHTCDKKIIYVEDLMPSENIGDMYKQKCVICKNFVKQYAVNEDNPEF